ncbi:MAG: metal-dependent transcriptional regulator [Candidatus Latescibacterota bacterium]|nr:MAG: metal-dependent transcriptional regulator [Candidatus Latescibacterota bacterium]
MKEKLSSNMEMYLKTIFQLEGENPPVRVKSIADSLGVTMPSVSEAVRNLKARGLVEHVSYGQVKLSADGRSLAIRVNERFESLRRFLIDVLRVDDSVAEAEACEIEHVVGRHTLGRLRLFIDWMKNHRPRDVDDCITEFHRYLDQRDERDSETSDHAVGNPNRDVV